MGYYVKYKELQVAQKSIFNQINQWNSELENARQKIQMVATMEEKGKDYVKKAKVIYRTYE